MHDIGKFYQRTFEKSNLTNDELAVTKYDKKTKRSSYLHSGYTLRFLKKYLGMKGEWCDDLVSRHHQNLSLIHILLILILMMKKQCAIFMKLVLV